MIDYRQTEAIHGATGPEPGLIAAYPWDHQVVGVLPFINVSRSPRLDDLSSAITNDVVEVLAGSTQLDLEVRRCTLFPSNTNVYLGMVGCCLNVELLMLGSIRETAGNILVIAQLICVTQCCPSWTFRYQGDMESRSAVAEQMASEIAAKVAVLN